MHEVTIEGYIISVLTDRFIVHAFNISKLKNILSTYGDIKFVPFIGKHGVKINGGDLYKIAKIQGITLGEYLNAENLDVIEISESDESDNSDGDDYISSGSYNNVSIKCIIRKNNIKGSTSLSIIAKNIKTLDNSITVYYDNK